MFNTMWVVPMLNALWVVPMFNALSVVRQVLASFFKPAQTSGGEVLPSQSQHDDAAHAEALQASPGETLPQVRRFPR